MVSGYLPTTVVYLSKIFHSTFSVLSDGEANSLEWCPTYVLDFTESDEWQNQIQSKLTNNIQGMHVQNTGRLSVYHIHALSFIMTQMTGEW